MEIKMPTAPTKNTNSLLDFKVFFSKFFVRSSPFPEFFIVFSDYRPYSLEWKGGLPNF